MARLNDTTCIRTASNTVLITVVQNELFIAFLFSHECISFGVWSCRSLLVLPRSLYSSKTFSITRARSCASMHKIKEVGSRNASKTTGHSQSQRSLKLGEFSSERSSLFERKITQLLCCRWFIGMPFSVGLHVHWTSFIDVNWAYLRRVATLIESTNKKWT